MAPHSSTLAWKIPWTEGPGGLQSMGSLGVGHDWATSLSLFLSCTGEGNGNPLQCSCLENPRDGGAWWASIYGAAQSQTQLKWLSSSSSSKTILRYIYTHTHTHTHIHKHIHKHTYFYTYICVHIYYTHTLLLVCTSNKGISSSWWNIT